jgi:hypothetical protein
MTGCQRRMGQDWRPDWAITNKMLHFMLVKIEYRLDQVTDDAERRHWIFAGGYFVLTYGNSLRGPEGLFLDLAGCLKKFSVNDTKYHVVFALLGTVKGEHLKREHLLPTVNDETQSGIPVRCWLKHILGANRMCGRAPGPAFCDEDGGVLTSRDLKVCLHEILGKLLIEHPNRWQKKEAAGTSRPGQQMHHHYADINILLPNFRRYTRVM